jgi:hypothetical protein
MKYVVVITERLEKGVLVDANSAKEAEQKVHEAYNNEEFTLDYSDYNGYEIECDREASEWDMNAYPKLDE